MIHDLGNLCAKSLMVALAAHYHHADMPMCVARVLMPPTHRLITTPYHLHHPDFSQKTLYE